MPKRFALGIVPVNRVHEAVSREVIAVEASFASERIEFANNPSVVLVAGAEVAVVFAFTLVVGIFVWRPMDD
jgi:hypothetical protein